MILDIIKHPDDFLRTECIPVKDITKKIKKLCKDMVKTMNANDGAGISAPQIGSDLRIIIWKDFYSNEDTIMINPKVVEWSPQLKKGTEGCLSMPNKLCYNIPRHTVVTVEYMNIKGKYHRVILDGINARIVQHELDHLDGKLITDF